MKRFLLITCAVLVAAAPASASVSRVVGMGGLGLYVMDDTNVYLWPQTLADWSNRAVGELTFAGAANSFRDAAVHLHLKRLGIHGAMRVNVPGSTTLRHTFTNVTGAGRHNIIGIANEEGTWGVQVGLGGDKFTLTVDTPADGTLIDESTSHVSVNAGVDVDYSEKSTGQLAAKLDIGSGKQEFQGGDGDVDETVFALRALARNIYDRGDAGKFVSIGAFSFGNDDIEFKSAAVPRGGALTDDKASFLAFSLGLGWHYPVADNMTVIAGVEPFSFATAELELISSAGTDTDKLTTLVYPSFFFGMEAWVSKWLVGRVGATQSNSTTKSESTTDPARVAQGAPTTSEVENSTSEFQISFGVGVKLGKSFTLDAVLNDQFFFTGPDFISGDSVAGNLATRVSATGTW